MSKYQSEFYKDLKETILLTNDLIVLQKDSRPLTNLYLQTVLCGGHSTGLSQWWTHVMEFFNRSSAERLNRKLAQKYLGSLWYLDHFIRHNGQNCPSYLEKAKALLKELDESYDFFEFAYAEKLLDTKTYSFWNVAEDRSRPLLEAVL